MTSIESVTLEAANATAAEQFGSCADPDGYAWESAPI
jgi:uncharacterized glyoxalase superfamily protein PhnB